MFVLKKEATGGRTGEAVAEKVSDAHNKVRLTQIALWGTGRFGNGESYLFR